MIDIALRRGFVIAQSNTSDEAIAIFESALCGIKVSIKEEDY